MSQLLSETNQGYKNVALLVPSIDKIKKIKDIYRLRSMSEAIDFLDGFFEYYKKNNGREGKWLSIWEKEINSK